MGTLSIARYTTTILTTHFDDLLVEPCSLFNPLFPLVTPSPSLHQLETVILVSWILAGFCLVAWC